MTYEEFAKFANMPENEGMRYEFIDGAAFMMSSPSSMHAEIISYAAGMAFIYLRGKKCRYYMNLDVHFENEDGGTDVLCPDLFINCKESRIKENFCEGAPEFVIEVASPSTRNKDYYFKRLYYLEHGVQEYWIIDPAKKRVIATTPGSKAIYSFMDAVTPRMFPGFQVCLSEFL